jgi:hypothetical protein
VNGPDEGKIQDIYIQISMITGTQFFCSKVYTISSDYIFDEFV